MAASGFAESTRTLTVGEVVRATESDFAFGPPVDPDHRGDQRACLLIMSQCWLRGALQAGTRRVLLEFFIEDTIGEVAEPHAPRRLCSA